MDNGNDDIFYLDRSSCGCIGIILRGKTAVFTGISVHQEPEKYRGDPVLLPLFLKQDFHFFFDKDDIHLDLYAVPCLSIIGYDSTGGYFATTEYDFSFQEDFPLFYISAERKLYSIEGNSTQFLTGAYAWKEKLKPSDAVKIFTSKQMAQKEFTIHDISELDVPVL